MTNAFIELSWRGLVYDHTEQVEELLHKEKITVYNGFDPTASSLHVGHFVPMMAMARLQKYGHSPIMVAGGGTGMIGDPSGRSTERQLLTLEDVEANVGSIKKQLASVLDFEVKSNPARLVNNADWLMPLSMMAFLRDVGKHFTVNYMVAKDSVKSRLEREDGLSYTEFSYMLLQAYDFLYLHDTYGCVLQTGGSDQWGNIVAGTELIRRARGQKAHALVYPLITKADGTKFGKTGTDTVWLDPALTSPYRFYQYWLNTDDAEVINYLKYFTWLTLPEITSLENALTEHPERREAQKRLAVEMTRTLHGETAVAKSEKASEVLFGGDLTGLEQTDIEEIFANVPSSQLTKSQLEGEGMALLDLLVHCQLATSKGDARRSVEGGGIYCNAERLADPSQMMRFEHTLYGQFLLLRKGRKQYHLVRVVA